MSADLRSGDLRRCTIVKIQSSDSPFDSLTSTPKSRNLNTKLESHGNRWTQSVALSLPKEDNDFMDSLTPDHSPVTTLTNPKAFKLSKESSVEEKKSNSPDSVGSDRHSNCFEDNFKRSETFSKKYSNFKDKECDIISDSRNSRCIFLSQIHLIFHISVTICLIGYQANETNVMILKSYRMLLIIYFGYLLLLSIVLMLLLRCYYIQSDDIGLKEIRSEQLSILSGASALGAINLAHLALEISECMHTELVIMPVLEFLFTVLLIHYLLTQVIEDRYLGLRNIVISHLLSTQISLWLISFDRKPEICSFSDEEEDCLNCTSFTTDVKNRESLLPRGVSNLMIPIKQNYELLTIFILITFWFTNNKSNISFIRAKLFDEEALKSAFLSAKSAALKGFAMGFAIFLLSIVVILFEDQEIERTAHIFIQTIFGIVLIIGLLIMRHKKKYLNYKYKMNFLDYHFLVYITLFASYVLALKQLLQLVVSPSLELTPLHQMLDGLTLILQISLQSFLIRLQRRKFVVMNQIFILSVLSNLSLWILEIYEIADKLSTVSKITDPTIVLHILVALNRFYSALVFYQFWKSN